MSDYFVLSEVILLRDGSLSTCEGVEDILIYLMEFLSPRLDLCKNFEVPYVSLTAIVS